MKKSKIEFQKVIDMLTSTVYTSLYEGRNKKKQQAAIKAKKFLSDFDEAFNGFKRPFNEQPKNT
jgi:hypothetical protein